MVLGAYLSGGFAPFADGSRQARAQLDIGLNIDILGGDFGGFKSIGEIDVLDGVA